MPGFGGGGSGGAGGGDGSGTAFFSLALLATYSSTNAPTSATEILTGTFADARRQVLLKRTDTAAGFVYYGHTSTVSADEHLADLAAGDMVIDDASPDTKHYIIASVANLKVHAELRGLGLV